MTNGDSGTRRHLDGWAALAYARVRKQFRTADGHPREPTPWW